MTRTTMQRKVCTLALAVTTSGSAFAASPAALVLDVANLGINTVNATTNALNLTANTDNLIVNKGIALSNLAQNGQLELIRQTLHDGGEGTIKNYTINIDKTLEFNTKITNNFTWIINEGGGEVVPIPFDLGDVVGGSDVDAYLGNYRTIEQHTTSPEGHYGDATAFEASRSRKAANDALVKAIASDDEALRSEALALKRLATISNDAKGHGHQLQVANALAGSQINQLMRLRSLTLVSEAARAAEAQAVADREARAAAVGIRLREGISDALEKTKRRSASY